MDAEGFFFALLSLVFYFGGNKWKFSRGSMLNFPGIRPVQGPGSRVSVLPSTPAPKFLKFARVEFCGDEKAAGPLTNQSDADLTSDMYVARTILTFA